MSFEHGGDIRELAETAGCEIAQLLDFSANINPLGPPEELRSIIARRLAEVAHYPDPHSRNLCEAIAAHFRISLAQVVPGNGSTELLYALPRVLNVRRAVIPAPSYLDYATAVERAGLEVRFLPLDERDAFKIDWTAVSSHLHGQDMVIAGQPCNPVGTLFDIDSLLACAARHPATFFVIDEAFADFIQEYRSVIAYQRPNIIVLRSMTKFYGIPGIRLGYLLAPVAIAQRLREWLPPWSVGTLAQAVGEAALAQDVYACRTHSEICEGKTMLYRALSEMIGIKVFPSSANFFLGRLERSDMDARDLARRLLSERIAIRVCDNYRGLDRRYFRVAVRSRADNERLVDAMAHLLGTATGCKATAVRRRTPAIMLQGVSSNAGKSVLSAALGRILLQDGYDAAPFKAQNMSLNSFVTRDGCEMGRAQVVQAQACRRDPDVRMNPVLLKPTVDNGSQVIVMGKAVGHMNVAQYIDFKPRAFAAARQAYDALAAETEAIVIEGAGSPAEVNLKRHDIVNMAMAHHSGAPVLLVGDIDRGGVFASFVGTFELLCEADRRTIAGFVINRFRGQPDLLHDALAYTADYTGVPTYGVVPFIPELGIPEEDSVSFKCGATIARPAAADKAVTIAVIDLPHIANFTDIDPLRLEPDVDLRVVRRSEELGRPDAVIVPGSKNVLDDLAHLRRIGLAERLSALAHDGKTLLIGICGGLQMFGETIADPLAIESARGVQPGLGLLAGATVLACEKVLRLTTARHTPSGLSIKGYEIHHGHTAAPGSRVAFVREDGEAVGFFSENGRVVGTYLHGVFDDDAFRRWFVDDLRCRRGLTPLMHIQAFFDIEPALDRLADTVRAHLDVGRIYRKMGLK